MKKEWEYLIVPFLKKERNREVVEKLLNELGTKGWELDKIIYLSEERWIVLKREKNAL
jgi:hypothetical protein